MFLSILYGILFWVATLILVLGVANKIRLYWNTPAPLKIPTTPAPVTQVGVVWRMIRELTLFQSLFRSSKPLWILAIVFHYGMLLVILRHFRYFIDPVWWWVDLVQPFGIYAGFAMVLGLLALWGRRMFIDRVRYISAPSDFLMLWLLIFIALSGLMMQYVASTDIVQVKAFFRGLMLFDWQPLPSDPILLLHLTLVAILMIIFPISKLLHAPGVFFSPTRNQVDNPREQRHVAPWAEELDKQDKVYLSELKK